MQWMAEVMVRSRTVEAALKRSHQVAKAPSPEQNPSRPNLDAARVLTDCLKILDVYREDEGSTPPEGFDETVAIVQCQRGLYLLETDVQQDAERDLEIALPVLEGAPARFGALLQQVGTVTW